MNDLAKNDIDWLEEHGFKWTDFSSCYKRNVGSMSLSIYYSSAYSCVVCFCFESQWSPHGDGKTAEEAFLDFLHKNKAHIDEMQSFLNELEKI